MSNFEIEQEFRRKQAELKLSFMEWIEAEFKKDENVTGEEIEVAVLSQLTSMGERNIIVNRKKNHPQ